MSGLFEHLAVVEEGRRTDGRKAVALARARANTRFAKFINASHNVEDREARLALVAGELEETVKQACADVDYDAWENVLDTVQSHLGMVIEARRPKMCPYHSEVTDISLAAGDPQAGFSAMAQHAWSVNHCQGEYEGRCNFKPEMTTQSYWDQKREKAEERRRERQEQIQQPQVSEQAPVDENFETEDWGGDEITDEPIAPEPSAIGMGAEPAQAEPQLAMAARTAATVPNPIIHGGSLAPLQAIAQRKPGLMVDGLPFEQWSQQIMGQQGSQGMVELPQVEVVHPNPTWEKIAAECLQVGSSQPLKQFFQQKKQQQQGAPGPQAPEAPGQQPLASVRQGEALKTIDVGESVGPVPKMDKRKWTPENVSWDKNAEMDGTPNPTRDQDIAEPAQYNSDGAFSDDGRFEQTNAVLEKQDVDQSTSYTDKYDNSWANSGGGKSAVSSTDPDKNPIRESLLSEEEAQRAIEEFNQEN